MVVLETKTLYAFEHHIFKPQEAHVICVYLLYPPEPQ